MARLSIDAERLGAEGFRLELGAKGDAGNLVALAPGDGIRGRYEQDDETIKLRSLHADTLALADLRWQLSNGRIELAGPSRLHGVEIDAAIGLGDTRPKFVGSIRAASLEATVNLRLGAVVIEGVAVDVRGFEFTADQDGTVAIRLGSITAGSVHVRSADLEVLLSDVRVPGACTIGIDGVRLAAIDIGRAQASVRSLAAKTSWESTAPGPGAVPELAFLRDLHGDVAVDVIPDVTLPFIGSRKATHAFRIPIEHGVISLDQLEAGLSTLESLVIDFEVQDGKLVLEKDIPLIPFDNKALVHWPLDHEAQTLANNHRRVAIATLLRPALPRNTRTQIEVDRKQKGKAVYLRRLDFANIAVALRCGGPSTLSLAGGSVRLGSAEQAAVGELRASGALTHAPDEECPGEVRASAMQIHGGISGVAVGTRRVDVTDVDIDAVEEVAVSFTGLRPMAVTAAVSGIRLRGLLFGLLIRS